MSRELAHESWPFQTRASRCAPPLRFEPFALIIERSNHKRGHMYVVVQHKISDPAAFWAKAEEMVPKLPSQFKLHHCLPTQNGSKGVCVWEGQSVEAVRSYLDGQVGHVSTNEYFEVENKEGVALPSRIPASSRK
jgi:hypothetical protein